MTSSPFSTVVLHPFFRVTSYYFPQCLLSASRTRSRCPTLLSLNGLACPSVTRTALFSPFSHSLLSAASFYLLRLGPRAGGVAWEAQLLLLAVC